jgi:hypothetical protein
MLLYFGSTHRVHILVEMKQGQCICPLSWSVHSNFSGEGKCNERGWACTPHPHQPGQILPSSLNVRQKAAVATLCTLWAGQPVSDPRLRLSTLFFHVKGTVQPEEICLKMITLDRSRFMFEILQLRKVKLRKEEKWRNKYYWNKKNLLLRITASLCNFFWLTHCTVHVFIFCGIERLSRTSLPPLIHMGTVCYLRSLLDSSFSLCLTISCVYVTFFISSRS